MAYIVEIAQATYKVVADSELAAIAQFLAAFEDDAPEITAVYPIQ